MENSRNIFLFGGLVALILLYRLGLGSLALFDWDELNFAEIGREMVESGNFLQPTINFLPFHEKPPLFSWLQAISQSIFGSTSFAARLPNLLCAPATFVALLWAGRKLGNPKLGWWWVAFMGGSLLPQLYFRSGIIDPWFNLFIFLSIAFLALPGRNPLKSTDVILAGLWLGLAVLTKGPAAGLIVALVLLWRLWKNPQDRGGRFVRYLGVGILALLPAFVWIGFLWQQDGGFFAQEFLSYQARLFLKEDAGHGGFPGFHVVVLLVGCFPASLYALSSLWSDKTDQFRGFSAWMRTLFWVVLVLFSIVNTKIVHYSSLAYFPITFFAAQSMVAQPSQAVARWIPRLNLFILLLIGGTLLLAPFLANYLINTNDFDFLDCAGCQAGARAAGLGEIYSTEPTVVWPLGLAALSLPVFVVVGFLVWKWKFRSLQAVRLQLGLSVFLVVFGLWAYAGRIQRYSQGPADDFYAALADRPVYVGTAYYKSYAHWFLTEIPPERGGRERTWRFHGPTDLDLYFSSPRHRTEQVLREVPDAILLYQCGRFSFYRRPAAE